MGVTLTILGSGSGGNSALLQTAQARALVDAGLSGKQLTARLALAGCAPEQLDAIFLTHEHSDHTQALTVLCRRHLIPLYANRATAESLSAYIPAKYAGWRFFETGQPFEIGDLRVEPFTVPHDANDPVGFVFRCSGTSVGFLTDLGHVTRLVVDHVKSVDALVLESNHDLRLLQDDRHKPWSLKQRIASRHGHLSNDAAARALQEMASDKLKWLCLAHLSQDCNRPELAEASARSALDAVGARGVRLEVASQNQLVAPCVL